MDVTNGKNQGDTNEGPGLYVHIPFCRSKCPYCAFYSLASSSLIPRWADAFRMEAGHYSDCFNRFETLYLGGGTPTSLDIHVLAGVLGDIHASFHFNADAEITIEANPGDLSKENIDSIKALGFNRISVGVQSFDDRILVFLGRSHSAMEALDALSGLRASGFENISIDLIYGADRQSLKGWIDTLKQAVEFRPEHISCYQLTFEKQTRLKRLEHKGLVKPINEKEEQNFFLTTSGFLRDNGYIHYEISSFAREKIYRSCHNSKYWRHTPYLGLGPSAHSFKGTNRWWNISSIKGYCRMLGEGTFPVDGQEDLTGEQMRLESIALGLRTSEGFSLTEIKDNPEAISRIMRLQEAGFINVENNRCVPTTKGFMVADSLPLYIMD